MRGGIEGYLSTELDRKVTIVDLDRPTATGFSADTMLIDIEVETDGAGNPGWSDRLVVQAAPTGPRLFENYDLARSFAVQRELANHDVPVARMHWLCEDRSWIGTPFYVMEYVAGRVPPDRPPYHREGWLFDSPIAERRAIWTAGIEAIAALHRVPIDRFPFLGDRPGSDLAGRRVEHWRSFGQDLGRDAEPALLRALDALEADRPDTGPPAVHWGDAKLGNMLFDRGRAAAILDWELCGLGVGEEDVAHWMAVDWFLSTGLGGDRLSGLPGPAATISRYESVVGRATIGIEWWFVFAIVRMGLIFQRAAVQSRRRNGGDGPLRANVIVPHLDRLLDGSAWAGYEERNRGVP